ncbi:MarR family transcriptional regulator [Clostridium sp. WLY-B-L2]|jgi:DNA-binding MarR family transcriptional regulator|uniref:MarR family transcriptional regulator n=1 Tax=Clostridium aromativorans TaxID=2836848 RepID=A0ABS8N6I0_9CLOT|nr:MULTISPECIES: MarR family transcriptional regulator [Clostridium]KAA8679395.1 MarR family transcriptional regulator [Clostridium sp. HV4-5-A1G]MCC9294333.1 MarR family transcriptional regulator [Clostridium aromativorans]CAB1262437.1 Putative HTH-type transcriptional regulator YusO [Clostridiaceae bacterium BL-3]
MSDVEDGIKLLRTIKRVMKNAHRIMGRRFKELNLTGPQLFVVMNLMRHGKMKISDLGEKMSLSNSTVSGIIDRLERQNVVKRTRSREDRRIVYVSVTPEFKKIADAKHEEVDRIFQSMIDVATPEEMDIISRGLYTLEKVMNRQKMNGE